MNSVLFILALLSIVSSIFGEHVSFNGQFECRIPSRVNDYCMLLRYREADTSGIQDDKIYTGRIECGGPKVSNVTTPFDGGDGLFNNYYEFKVLISHTCTYDGRIRLYSHDFPYVPIDAKQYKFDYNVDLTEQGFPIFDYLDVTRMHDGEDTRSDHLD